MQTLWARLWETTGRILLHLSIVPAAAACSFHMHSTWRLLNVHRHCPAMQACKRTSGVTFAFSYCYSATPVKPARHTAVCCLRCTVQRRNGLDSPCLDLALRCVWADRLFGPTLQRVQEKASVQR